MGGLRSKNIYGVAERFRNRYQCPRSWKNQGPVLQGEADGHDRRSENTPTVKIL
jgi:hypothetical protein